MGVAFDRVLEPFSGPFERVTDWNVAPPPGRITAVQGAGVYQIDRRANDAYRAVNRLLAQGARVTATHDAFYVGASAQATAQLQKIAADLGVSAQGLASAPTGPHSRASSRGSACGISTADRSSRAGPDGSWSNSSSRSNACSRRSWTRASCTRRTTC